MFVHSTSGSVVEQNLSPTKEAGSPSKPQPPQTLDVVDVAESDAAVSNSTGDDRSVSMDMTLDMEVGEDVITGGGEDYTEDACINQVIFPHQHGFIYCC